MSNLRPVAVITGASAEIGAELARVFARDRHELVLVARREDRLRGLADEIASTGAPRPIVVAADLLKPEFARVIGDALTAQGVEPQFVVNNAGFGLVGAASNARSRRTIADDRSQRARVDRVVACLCRQPRPPPRRAAEHRLDGRISARAGMAVYYATKAYVLSFSEALHSELKPRGIRVTVLCPGPVPTEFAGRAGLSKSAMGPSISDSIGGASGRSRLSRSNGWTPRRSCPGPSTSSITFLISHHPAKRDPQLCGSSAKAAQIPARSA